MRKMLTDRLVKAKDPTGGEATDVIWDEALTGLAMRLGKTRRTYFVQSRVNGKLFKMAVGRVRMNERDTAALTLADARKKAGELLVMAQNGTDPRKAEEIARQEATRARLDTFRAVSEAYMQELGQHLKSGPELQRKLNKDILPALGDIPVADVRRVDIKAFFLSKAEATPVQANRLLGVIRVILNYAIDEELIDANPAARIKARPETPRDRYLSEAEIKSFWLGLDAATFEPQIRRILQLLLVTGQRRAEVGHMKWVEIDAQKAIWELPAGRTKAGRAHRVPLTPLALSLIGEPGAAGGEYVFSNGGGQPFALMSIGQALTRELPALGLASNPATVHDLRRTMATHLSDLGIDRIIIGKLLNHAEQGVTGRVYDLGAYAEPKRLAMVAWSNKLVEITTGKSATEKVVSIRGSAS